MRGVPERKRAHKLVLELGGCFEGQFRS